MLRRAFAATAATAALLLAGAGQAMAGPAPAPAPAAALTAPPSTCPAVVRLVSLAFDPAVIAAGRSSTATLTAVNCTGTAQSVSETWSAVWVSGSATGIPAGCPAVDPLLRQVVLGPYQHQTTSTTYTVFPGCTADGLRLTVSAAAGGVRLGQLSATLLITHPSTTG